MSQEQKSWFIISNGSAPVYKHPTFQSPWVSEVVYGESCKILIMEKNWIQIKCEDDYVGWVHSFYGIKKMERNNPRYIIAYPNEYGFFSCKYPFGAMLREKIPGSIPFNEKLGLDNVINIGYSLLGIPYRWGGKSSLGFDCSGLVQSVLKICGLNIPRDAQDQRDFFHDTQIDLYDAQPGDLHFFGEQDNVTHVGFSTGEAGLLHSQGLVKKDSIDSSINGYNKKLLDIYLSTHSIKCKFKQ